MAIFHETHLSSFSAACVFKSPILCLYVIEPFVSTYMSLPRFVELRGNLEHCTYRTNGICSSHDSDTSHLLMPVCPRALSRVSAQICNQLNSHKFLPSLPSE